MNLYLIVVYELGDFDTLVYDPVGVTHDRAYALSMAYRAEQQHPKATIRVHEYIGGHLYDTIHSVPTVFTQIKDKTE